MRYVMLFTVIALISGCKKIQVPYFDKMTPEEVCGGTPEYCQPTSSQKWAKIKPGKDYDGRFDKVLGRKFDETAFENVPFAKPVPTKNDIVISGKSTVEGKLSSTTKNDFQLKISADIMKLLEAGMETVPKGLRADVEAQVKAITAKVLTQNISLEYKRIDLSGYYIDEHIYPRMSELSKNDKVITGMSLITVEGKWSKDTMSDVLVGVEAGVGYEGLTAALKEEFSKVKKKVLAGEFDPTSFYFAVAYREN